MFKKIASIAIVAMMLGGTAAIAASAAEADEAVAAAEDSAVGADSAESVAADSSDATGADNKIYFDVNGAGWKNYTNITFYLYEHNGSEIITWGSKKGRMEDEGGGKYSFELTGKYELDSSKEYGCIFTADWGAQTCDLMIGTGCLGDTAFCTESTPTVENNVDSNKKSYAVKWTNADPTVYGVPRCITSIGNVIGEAYWKGDSAYAMFVRFLSSTGIDGIDNALKFNKKTVQQTIDDTANTLGLGQDDIEAAIKESGRTFDWKKTESKASEGSNASSRQSSNGGGSNGGSGTTDGGSATNTNNGGSTTNSGSTSTNNGGSSSSGSSSTGSVTSGEGDTLYIILGGVLVAAAGVFFLARKKREY